MVFESYAQNLEDVILWRALKNIEQGFYIDAGAFDPKTHSVTRAFYDRGWHGINIEPVTSLHEKFLKDRPKDINLQFVLSDKEGDTVFFEIGDTGLSTAVQSVAQHHTGSGFQYRETQKKTTTLTRIIQEYAPNLEIHFLKIDVEGYEEQVLQGIDFALFRPWILLIESTYPLTQNSCYLDWETLLTQNGYTHVYSDGLNRFYLADEHDELKKYFEFPPNVFDNYLPMSAYSTQDSNDLVKDLNEKQNRIVELEGELELIKNSKSWKISLNLARIYRLIGLRQYGLSAALSDLKIAVRARQWDKFCQTKIEDLVPIEFLQLIYTTRPISRSDWKSEVISEKRFRESNFFLWMSLLRETPRLHSKQFQNYAIMEAANSLIDSGRVNPKAIGFGVGTEPIPAGLVKIGYEVVATDYLDGEIADDWKNTDQLVSTPDDLNTRGILTKEEFDSRVQFLNMDMNVIPENLNNQFDFVWSSCALGHIGGYDNGLRFIKRSVELLAPGGIALHTTELDVSIGKSKYESPTLSLYRKEDLEELIEYLRANHFKVDHFEIPKKWLGASEKFVDKEPWGVRPHLRIDVFGREILSLVLRIQKTS